MLDTMNGFNVILLGAGGTGKTHSLSTLVETGLEVFYLGLENGIETLIGCWADKGLPIPANLHWANVMSSSVSFGEQLQSAKAVNSMTFEGLTKMVDPNRGKYQQFQNILKLLSNFVDERTGTNYGPVDKWSFDKVLAIDGLTGINSSSMSTVVGGRPTKSMADWGVAQNLIMNLLDNLTNSCPCHFVLCAHVEREVDQINGGVKLMPATLGKAISGLIVPKFSDAILCERQGDNWHWNTSSPLADLKTRNLPVAAKLPPSFKPIYEKWRNRKEAMGPVKAVETSNAKNP